MITYRNEAAFSRALVAAMRRKGIFVQRIESGETGRGIPDLFVIIRSTPMWIELKRIHNFIAHDTFVEISWRPGQQAWLHDVASRGVMTFTLACFDDGILKIPPKLFSKNRVPVSLCKYYKDIRSLLS